MWLKELGPGQSAQCSSCNLEAVANTLKLKVAKKLPEKALSGSGLSGAYGGGSGQFRGFRALVLVERPSPDKPMHTEPRVRRCGLLSTALSLPELEEGVQVEREKGKNS